MNWLRVWIYALGFRPKPGKFLYSEKLEAQEKWRNGQ